MLFLAGEPEVPPDTLSSQWPDINIGEVRMGGLNQQHNAHVRARDLFNRALFIGQMRKLGAAITRRSRRLLFLGGVENSAHVVNHHQLNRQAVRLELIQDR
jgi:hypothetical protein